MMTSCPGKQREVIYQGAKIFFGMVKGRKNCQTIVLLQPMPCHFAQSSLKNIYKWWVFSPICLRINILFNMLHLCIQLNGNKHKLYNADKRVAYMYVSLVVTYQQV